ncbi:MAG TPA: helix-hairpin-helix domain-containing protein [Candidatus Hydrogenedens sp.]|nr:helix-hairpin-helix domain-containing protein [Candidatus Hydrogenedens sp.]
MRIVLSDVEWYYGRYILAGIVILVSACGGVGIYYYETKYSSAGQEILLDNKSESSQEISFPSAPLQKITPVGKTKETNGVTNEVSPSPPLSLSDTEKLADFSQEGEKFHKIGVGIRGAVQKPGLYWVVEGTRLQELIDMAGGALDNAELQYLNIAAVLLDGTTVVIPEQQKVEFDGQRLYAHGVSQPTGSVIYEGGYYNNPDRTLPKSSDSKTVPTPPFPDTKGKSTTDGLIDINHATQQELESLPGIGPVLAQAIISYREIQPFQRVEDLLNVSGIGPKRFEKIHPFVTVSSP